MQKKANKEVKKKMKRQTKITRVGGSNGIILDKFVLFCSGLQLHDKVEIEIFNNKLVITKKEGE